MRRQSRTGSPAGWILRVAGVLAATTGCAGDAYARYAAAVHDDADAAMLDAFRMTARLQLTVVHNTIPFDSLAVVTRTVKGAAEAVRERATHFAAVTPPPDLAQPHANLSAELTRLAQALSAMASTFERCGEAVSGGDSTGKACQAHLAAVSSQFGYVGEDLRLARNRVQRFLLPHGVMLPRISRIPSESADWPLWWAA